MLVFQVKMSAGRGFCLKVYVKSMRIVDEDCFRFVVRFIEFINFRFNSMQ